jgi:hypothetical protein
MLVYGTVDGGMLVEYLSGVMRLANWQQAACCSNQTLAFQISYVPARREPPRLRLFRIGAGASAKLLAQLEGRSV